MSVREYIGARYVPVFADPIQWDPTNVYEPLTVVTNQGASYVSRKSVPTGILLSNTDYWILWADYNAQLQHYIDEVNTFDGRIDALEDALPIADFSSVNTVSGKFPIATADIADDAVTAAKIDDAAIGTAAIIDASVTDAKLASSAKALFTDRKTILVFGDSWGSTDAASVTARDNGASYITRIKLKRNDRIYNFCDGGAGFADTSSNVWNTNFAGQIAHAISDVSFDNDDVTDVIVMGGINDVGSGYTPAQVRSAVIAFIEASQAAFTNARIIVCGCTTRRAGSAAFYTSTLEIMKAISKVTTEYACDFYPACTWMIGDPTCWSTDNYHPNNHGGYILAAFIGGIIYGQTPSYYVDYPLNAVKDGSTSLSYTTRSEGSNLSFNMFDGTIGGCFDVTLSETWTSGNHYITMESNKDSPFIFNNTGVSYFFAVSRTAPDAFNVSGAFTGAQNGTSYDVCKLWFNIQPVASTTLTRLQLSPNGRVF